MADDRDRESDAERGAIGAAAAFCCPEIGEVLGGAASLRVDQYCEQILHAPIARGGGDDAGAATGAGSAEVAARLFEEELRAAVAARGDSDAEALAEAVVAEFRAHSVIQTAAHAQLLLDPDTFFCMALHALGAARTGRRHLLSYLCSTNTFTTRQRSGPGWLRLGGRDYNLFGLAQKHLKRSLCAYRGEVELALKPASTEGTDRAHGAGGGDGGDGGDGAAAARLLAQLRRVGAGRYPSPVDALMAINRGLWEAWQAGPGSVAPTEPILFSDAFMARLAARHLRSAESPVAQLLLDGAVRDRLLAAVEAERIGIRRLAYPARSDFFWGMARGRLRPLRIAGAMLREVPVGPAGEGQNAGGTGEFDVRWEREALVDALLAGALTPNLLLVFLMIGILPGYRVLGGPMQMIYYPMFWRAAAAVLGAGVLPPLEHGWVMGLVDWRGDLPAELCEHRPGQELAGFLERFGAMTVKQASGGLRPLAPYVAWANGEQEQKKENGK